MVNQSSGFTAAAVVPGILGNRHPSIAPYEVYEASDHPFALAVGNDRQFAALCAALELPELIADPRFVRNADRVAHVEELAALLTPRLATRTAAEWFELLTPVGVPCGPVNDLAGAFALAERLGLAPRVTLPDSGVELVANPIGLSATPPEYRSPPPRLGEHSAQLREWLGRRPEPGRNRTGEQRK
jgi:crotonobetainyl-CoA:carnitine CoA-transferase CaiB-like acyl-CoA transferase